MNGYQDKKVVIIGLGLTGLSCVNYFINKGVTPKVIDTRPQPSGLDKLPRGVECHCGSLQRDWLMAADLIVSSPGISLRTPELVEAAKAGIEIVGDIELFCREAAAPVVAITGSNGKSTVTTLVGEMAKAAGLRVGVGGNIGVPALMLLDNPCDLYVLELSSFQLETTYSLEAAAATILNLSEDHLNRYPLGMNEYCQAKQRIYHNAKVAVINHDDAMTDVWEKAGQTIYRFGVEQGDYHLAMVAGEAYLTVHDEPFLACNDMQLTGQHNYMNALAAIALAQAVAIPDDAIREALRQFGGLAHRFKTVLVRNQVRWVNDSKATNVGSTEAALRGLVVNGTLHLLLGGDGKAADFSPLKPYISGDNVRIYCFGQDAKPLYELRPEIATLCSTMEEAMRLLAPHLVAGDMVLLSPACASLDQFKNFEVRGDEFARLAQELG